MSTTARLNLPYIAPQQAQKQVTYNEAMALLDQLVQPVVLSRTTSTPPDSPDDGDLYIVGAGGTDAWAGKDGRFAAWRDGGWVFTVPAEGWSAHVVDTGETATFDGSAWSAASETGSFTPTLAFGGGSTGITYGGATAGRFVRVGTLLIAIATIALTAKGSSTGAATIGGLPVASAAGPDTPVLVGAATGLSSVSGALVAQLPGGASAVALSAANSGAATALTDANFSNASALTVQAIYTID